MIQYIVILLDDTSTSFCNYKNANTERKLIPLQTLKDGIRYAMMENLNIQFVYPNYVLPIEYQEAIDSIDHTDIKPSVYADNANVVVFDSLAETKGYAFKKDIAYLVHTDKNSIVKDPMFADYENKNFSLTKASPAKEIGFFDIDMSDVGIRR